MFDLYTSNRTQNVDNPLAQSLTQPIKEHFKSDMVNYWSTAAILQVVLMLIFVPFRSLQPTLNHRFQLVMKSVFSMHNICWKQLLTHILNLTFIIILKIWGWFGITFRRTNLFVWWCLTPLSAIFQLCRGGQLY